MFRIFEVIDDFVNDIVISKIADLIVKAIELIDIRTQLKKSLGAEIGHLNARQITLDELKGVSSNE